MHTLMKVLVVDDSPQIVTLIKEILKRKGILHVDGAYDGEEALRKIDSEDYDFCVFDYELPGVDGLTLARRAEKKFGRDKVMIISAYEDFEHNDFKVLYKPFKPHDLLKSLK